MAVAAVVATEPTTDPFRAAFDAAVEEHAPKPAAEPDPEPEPAAEPTPAAVVATPETDLISDEEFTALETTHADDIKALRKALQGAFTKKTQALAEKRKAVERLEPYAGFVDLLETDPARAIRDFAQLNGLNLSELGGAAREPGEVTRATRSTETVVDSALAEFRKDLGPDLDWAADNFAPAITKLVERLTARTVDQSVEPLRAQTQSLVERVAVEQTDAVMKTFGEKHADWQQHEAAMMAIAQKVQPKGMSELEFLEHLYAAATREQRDAEWEASVERAANGRFKKRVEKMNTAEADTTVAATPESQVRKRPNGPVSFQDAAQAAIRGERFEDD